MKYDHWYQNNRGTQYRRQDISMAHRKSKVNFQKRHNRDEMIKRPVPQVRWRGERQVEEGVQVKKKVS